METRRADIAAQLDSVEAGDPEGLHRLLPLVYDELRQLASGYLRVERSDHTLETTGLVHEAYLRIAGERTMSWQSRSHFFGIAAQAMRRILVDHARRRRAAKRDGGVRVTLEEDRLDARHGDDILGVDEALERLAKCDERQARIVELRYFAGLSIEETADAIGISPATVKREWMMARAWLQRELR